MGLFSKKSKVSPVELAARKAAEAVEQQNAAVVAFSESVGKSRSKLEIDTTVYDRPTD